MNNQISNLHGESNNYGHSFIAILDQIYRRFVFSYLSAVLIFSPMNPVTMVIKKGSPP